MIDVTTIDEMGLKEDTWAHILIVEDEANLRRLFAQFLQREKYQVEEAESGEQALQKITANKFDVIVTDLQMAGVSGLEVLQAAKEKDPLTQVLIVTGYGSIATAVDAMRRGAYEYLTKPMHLEALGLKVRNALERRRLLVKLREQEEKINMQRQALERDLELARQVQTTLVPEQFCNPWLQVNVYYRPMIGLGGDFADIYENGKGEVYLSVIDVTGHGIAAALVVNRVCSELRKLVRDELAPKDILYELNESFIRTFADSGIFLTMMSIKCQPDAGRLVYSGSAHPAAILWSDKQQKFQLLHSQNPIIGFARMKATEFLEGQIDIASKDRLYVYTDGVLEVENGLKKPLGLKGLMQLIRPHVHDSAQVVASRLGEEIGRYGHEMGDDVLLLVADF